MSRGGPAAALAVVLATAFGIGTGAPAAAQEFATAQGRVRVVAVAAGLEHPWGLAFLPDGRFLVTERPGRLRVVGADGRLSAPVEGVPAVAATGQGGLLDVVLDPQFATNRRIWLSYAEPGPGRTAGTAVARARFDGPRLSDVAVVWRQEPKVDGGLHFGSRLVFARDGRLFVTTGDRNERDNVQSLGATQGKVIRIDTEGRTPADNPFVGRAGAKAEIWSYGHRNIQGAALHPVTGELWTHEHGPRGGDELNRTLRGANYGWPVITYGREYYGLAIGEGTSKPGMQQPVKYWVPSFAPSGLAFYQGDRFPAWRNSALIGALVSGEVVRVELDADGRFVREERLLTGLGQRIRDVRVGPDGLVYLLTDARDGWLLRVEPVATGAPGR